MKFEGMEKNNKNKDQNSLETDISAEKIDENSENQEDVVNQDPDYGFLSEDKAFEKRKDLSKIINEFLSIKKELITNKEDKEGNKDKEDRIKQLKGEINKLIGREKEQ